MWKRKGTWVALAVVAVASMLIVASAFAQTSGKIKGKGRSCCGDRQISKVASAPSAHDKQAEKHECKGEGCKHVGCKHAEKHECKGEGCKHEGCKYAAKADHACCKSITKDVKLCTHCGHMKGGEKCCKEGMEKCGKCGLAKDSLGCCRIPAGAKEASLCGKCGHVKGAEQCCAKDMEMCGKCGLAKGSPGCALKCEHKECKGGHEGCKHEHGKNVGKKDKDK